MPTDNTFTVDTATPTETVTDDVANLTPEEQDSLAVGEKMVAEQDQLLAGKYKDAQELEKAYVELQKKLGEQDTEASSDSGEQSDSDTETESEETEEAKETSPAVELINEASAEYYANDGDLKPETVEKFSSMSSQDLVNAYIQMQKDAPAEQEVSVPDLTQGDINDVHNSVGGQAEYTKLVTWASENMSGDVQKSFDDLVSTGNVGAIKLAVNGLKAQYENDNGYEGRMLSGKAPASSKDTFRSQAELVEAMSDRRYDNDPAYRQDVIEKLDRSNLKF